MNVYGPHQDQTAAYTGVVPILLNKIQANESPTINGDGSQAYDFIYVEDCVAAIEWILDQDAMTGLYNLGTGEARSFLDMASAVAEVMGEKLTVEWIDTPADLREKYQYFTEAKMDRLREAGFSLTFTSLEDGIKRYVQQFLSESDPYR